MAQAHLPFSLATSLDLLETKSPLFDDSSCCPSGGAVPAARLRSAGKTRPNAFHPRTFSLSRLFWWFILWAVWLGQEMPRCFFPEHHSGFLWGHFGIRPTLGLGNLQWSRQPSLVGAGPHPVSRRPAQDKRWASTKSEKVLQQPAFELHAWLHQLFWPDRGINQCFSRGSPQKQDRR